MERDSQLDTACSASIEFVIVLVKVFGTIPLILLIILLLTGTGNAQCASGMQADAEVHGLYSQQKWDDAIAAATRLGSRSADVNFDVGMALAHLQRWNEARDALIAGQKQCPAQKRFPTELAGVAFELKRYAEASHWIEKALRLDPRDEYANEFAGTVFLLMDNLDAALKYWNRIRKPQIEMLRIDPNLKVQRLLVERAFVFSPQAEMRRDQLLASEARLNAMGIFPAYSIRLNAREGGRFDAQFNAIERNGFGNGWLQSVVSVFSGLPYETLYPSYFNARGSATNVDSIVRWDVQKRRIWVSATGPWHYLPQWRWGLAVDGRDENWAIRSSFAGNAPMMGAFRLKREVAAGSLKSIRSGRFQWQSGAEISHRAYTEILSGTVLNGELASPGWGIKYLASASARVLDVPEQRFTIDASASSELERLWSKPPRLFERAQAGISARWLPKAEGDGYEYSQRVRGGGIAGSAPMDELWMIGVERDTDLWLRGHIGTRGGKKGSAPMGERYFLSNSDFYRDVWSNGLISVKAGPLLDIARVGAPTRGLAPKQWLFDIGAEVKLTVLGTAVVLTYGRDLRTGNNAFYGSVAQH